ncbi:regulatory protein [Desulfuromusa kysingii]|uniref:Regulatory protein RecX n=1 Tax=Desulfuromusa kysingii TaxID=37625 RepID=A0A1H3VXI0_9BACT|nr:regulatory protein RecX [Desulfuromusa kysingii]SDZ79565.1 regulatory protein [Desulfuromusa kysingii]
MEKSKSKDSKSFAAALRVLSRRDRSETELRQKLEQFGFSLSAIDTAIAKCREYNYLNDERYALERARSFMRSGRGVGVKIMFDLRRRGIDELTAQHAVEAAAAEFSPTQILHEQLNRRFPTFNYDTANAQERRRVVSFFQRRGFGLEAIFQVVKQNQLDH